MIWRYNFSLIVIKKKTKNEQNWKFDTYVRKTEKFESSN